MTMQWGKDGSSFIPLNFHSVPQVDRLIDFSPPYSTYTSDLITFVAKTFDTAAFNQFKEKWTTTITSLTITGPPQYTSILGKVRTSETLRRTLQYQKTWPCLDYLCISLRFFEHSTLDYD